jgi:uncharacterized membrane protein
MKYIIYILPILGLILVCLNFFEIYTNTFFPVIGYTLIFLGLVITLYIKTKAK